MRLIPQAHLWHRFWSVRFLGLAMLFDVLGEVLPAFMDAIPRWPFAVLSLLAGIGAFMARFVLQPELGDADQ